MGRGSHPLQWPASQLRSPAEIPWCRLPGWSPPAAATMARSPGSPSLSNPLPLPSPPWLPTPPCSLTWAVLPTRYPAYQAISQASSAREYVRHAVSCQQQICSGWACKDFYDWPTPQSTCRFWIHTHSRMPGNAALRNSLPGFHTGLVQEILAQF
jgi:hypothetical protein